MPASAVLIPFFVMCVFLVLMSLIVGWGLSKARRPRSPLQGCAAARGWSYVSHDAEVTAGLGPATHVVRGRHDGLSLVAYEQYPAPGQRYAVTEVILDRAWPPLAATPVGPLSEQFATGGTPVDGLVEGYIVTCPDDEFARSVLVGSVRRVLRGKGLLVRERRLVVVQSGAQTAEGLDAALALLTAATERVGQYR